MTGKVQYTLHQEIVQLFQINLNFQEQYVSYELQNFNFIGLNNSIIQHYLINQKMRSNMTHLKHRSFSLEKRSTISTRENLQSLTKSFTSKSSGIIKSTHQQSKVDLMTASLPVEIYFNPQFRKNYTMKVIDSFFNQFDSPSKTIDSDSINLFISPQKQSIRNRLWKKRNTNNSNFEVIDTSKFIRSSPKKSIPSEFSQQKSLNIIAQDIEIPSNELNQVQVYGQSIESFSSISLLDQSRFVRPFSQQKKKTKNWFTDQKKISNSDTFSLFFNESRIPRQKLRRQVRKMTDSQKQFQEFTVFEDGEIVNQVRKYQYQRNPMFIRQDKICKKGVKMLWKYSKFQFTLQYPILKSVKDLLSQQFYFGSNQLDFYTEIYPKPYYQELFLNKNQELIDIIVSMTKFIINNKGKILTCAFQTKNLYKTDQKQYLLKDLGSSAIVQQIKIRDKTITYLYPPLFKEEGPAGQWLVRPEYLAPEVIDSIINSEYSWLEQKPDDVMSAQVWSLGCMILQILTIIPLNSDIRCRVKSNPDILRRGFLSIKSSSKQADFQMLRKKQSGLQMIFKKSVKTQLKNVPVEKKVLQVLQKMLIYEPSKRIKPQQILSQIKY